MTTTYELKKLVREMSALRSEIGTLSARLDATAKERDEYRSKYLELMVKIDRACSPDAGPAPSPIRGSVVNKKSSKGPASTADVPKKVAKDGSIRPATYQCGGCGEFGHNTRTCSK
jgi:hypothetical protein